MIVKENFDRLDFEVFDEIPVPILEKFSDISTLIRSMPEMTHQPRR